MLVTPGSERVKSSYFMIVCLTQNLPHECIHYFIGIFCYFAQNL